MDFSDDPHRDAFNYYLDKETRQQLFDNEVEIQTEVFDNFVTFLIDADPDDELWKVVHKALLEENHEQASKTLYVLYKNFCQYLVRL